MKVALDAGHGARGGRSFTGARANGLVEDELALDFVRRVGHHLRKAGHETVYTRSDRNLVSLSLRGRIACEAECDAFLSFHCNAGPQQANGVEAFVARGDERSKALARTLVDTVAQCGMNSRGVKWDCRSQHRRLRVLQDTYRTMPAVLLELGFLTNPDDASLLKNRFFRESISRSIADALDTALID